MSRYVIQRARVTTRTHGFHFLFDFRRLANVMAAFTARDLAEFDDIAVNLVVDPTMGFSTHKMNAKFRPVRNDVEELRRIVDDYQKTHRIDDALARLFDGKWASKFFVGKTENQIGAFREHVSEPYKESVGRANLRIQGRALFENVQPARGLSHCPVASLFTGKSPRSQNHSNASLVTYR